jgi:hypothetical protein
MYGRILKGMRDVEKDKFEAIKGANPKMYKVNFPLSTGYYLY